MSRGFRMVPLEQLCGTISSGGTPSRKKAEFYSQGNAGHLWVKSKELLDRSISDTEEKITDEGLACSAARYYRAETVLIAMYGANVGQLAWLRVPATVNQAVCALVTDKRMADFRYVFYALLQTRAALATKAQGAAQQNLNQGLIRQFAIPAPGLHEQRKIAAILAAYDDLMENNLRRIQILEEMAQALYREWFVEFRFPGHERTRFTESALGSIPNDWTVRDLLDEATVQYGHPFKSKLFHEEPVGVPVVRIRNVPRGVSGTYTTEAVDDKFIIHDGQILVGMDGDFHMCMWSGGRSYQNQRVARFAPKSDAVSPHLLFLLLKKPIEYLNATITGTTVAHLGHKHIKRIQIAVLPRRLLDDANGFLQPVAELQLALKVTNHVLRKSRDLLLPRLISGELDVSQLDIGVGEAA